MSNSQNSRLEDVLSTDQSPSHQYAVIAPIARAYALALARARLFDQEAEATVELPQIPDGIDNLNLDRTAVLEILVAVGGEDPDAWASLLGLLLATHGDRFVEVCDGRL